jgi:hypothetical protein
VPKFFLGFHGRSLSAAFACFGLAAMAPSGLKGFSAFLTSPPGGGVIALALITVGSSVEETGTIRRIRIGTGLRLAAAAVLVVAAIWAAVLGAPTPGLGRFGWFLFALGAVGVGIALAHDAGAFMDPRYGQAVRLEKVSADGLEFSAGGEQVILNPWDVLGVSAAGDTMGRAVVILTKERGRLRGNTSALPWIGSTRDGDAFMVTEHQAGMDVEVLVRKILDVAEAAQGGYRQ